MTADHTNCGRTSYDRQQDRYLIHELLRQFGADKLAAEIGTEQMVREKHSTYFCKFLQEREAEWRGPRQREVATEVQSDINNIQRAWSFAVKQEDARLLFQGLESLCQYYSWRGLWVDGIDACRRAEVSLEHLTEGDNGQVRTALAHILTWQTYFIRDGIQKQKLLTRSQQLLDRLTQAGNDTRALRAFICFTKAFQGQNVDPDKSKHNAEISIALFRELAVPWREAEALGLLGIHYLYRGRFTLADKTLRHSLEISQQLNDMLGRAMAINTLGIEARYQGDFEKAEMLQRQSLNLFRQVNHRWGERNCLCELSYTLSWAGMFPAANVTSREAEQIHRVLDQSPSLNFLNPLIMANIHLGHYEKAYTIASQGLDLGKNVGWPLHTAFVATFLGKIAFVRGDFDDAKIYLLESNTILARLGHVHQAFPQAVLSYVIRAQSDSQFASARLADILRLGMENRSIYTMIYCLPIAALLAADKGDSRRAIELYGATQRFGHITKSRWFADVACRELDEVGASLPPNVARIAEARGRELDVWQTAEALLTELAELG